MTVGGLTYSDLPSVRRLCSQVVDDLCSGQTVFWLASRQSLMASLVEVIGHECLRRDMYLRQADVTEWTGKPPASALVEALDLPLVQPGSTLNPGTLLHHPIWPDVVIVEGLSTVTPDEQARWCRFAADWAKTTHGAEVGFSHKALLFPAHAGIAGLPRDDLRLVVRRLWGNVSHLEMQILARSRLDSTQTTETWSEAVLTELAGTDPDLLKELIAASELDGSGLIEFLADYGRQTQWDKRSLVEMSAEKVLETTYVRRTRARFGPPAEFERLWQIGALSWTSEYGIELHSAAVALLGRVDILDHRIWRGQARILLPLIDAVRRDICNYLTRYHGPYWVQWAHTSHSDDIQGYDRAPLSQLGHLLNVIFSKRLSSRVTDYLLEPVQFLAEARNSLAHYRPVTLKQFARVLAMVQRLEGLK